MLVVWGAPRGSGMRGISAGVEGGSARRDKLVADRRLEGPVRFLSRVTGVDAQLADYDACNLRLDFCTVLPMVLSLFLGSRRCCPHMAPKRKPVAKPGKAQPAKRTNKKTPPKPPSEVVESSSSEAEASQHEEPSSQQEQQRETFLKLSAAKKAAATFDDINQIKL